MRTALAILRKDLLLERRTLETIPSMAMLAVVTFIIFHFGLNQNQVSGQLAAGVLTITLLFAAMLGLWLSASRAASTPSCWHRSTVPRC